MSIPLIISFIIFCKFLLLPVGYLYSQEVRAIWVTRWDYASPDDIRKIIDNAADHNFNMVLFQVRGNGTVYYPSKYEPWTEALGSTNPGWNPLREAIDCAKKRKIQLHAWINMYPSWRGIDAPNHPNQIFNTHHEWLMVDADRNSMKLNSHYVWNNPAHPDVQKHLANIVLELADIPGLDGVHFDYFRYPGPGYSYDSKTLNIFLDEFKIQPSQSIIFWNKFRLETITRWLRQVYSNIKTRQPNFQISAAVIGDYDLGPKVFFQDAHQWLSEGIIDFIFPMTYTNDIRMLERWLNRHGIHLRKERIYPGLMVYPEMELLQDEIQLVQEKGFEGFSVFAYSSLFPNHLAVERIEVLHSDLNNSSTLDSIEKTTTGGIISEILWFPKNPVAGDSIMITCKINRIESDANVYAFLIWKSSSSKKTPPRLNLKRMKSKPEYWYSLKKIPPQKAGATILLRAFVGYPNENIKQAIASDRYSIMVDTKESHYRSEGEFGPLLTLVTRGVIDHNNRAWLLEPGIGIRVIEADGTEASFSPVSRFTSKNGNSQHFTTTAGITLLPNNTIAVSALKGTTPILLTNRLVQSDLSMNFQLPLLGIDLASTNNGSLFILSLDGWFILNPDGKKIGEVLFPQIHTVNNIAVSADGRNVFVACRSEGAVHHWIGSITEDSALYKQTRNLDIFNIGIGGVTFAADGFLYLAETPGGVVRVLDNNLGLVDILYGDKPGLTAPRLVLPLADSSILYIFETGGTTPIRMQKWVEKNSIF